MGSFDEMEFCNSGDLAVVVGFLRSVARDSGRYATFYGPESFDVMIARGLISEGTILRRQAARGPADDTYQLNRDGRLVGRTDVQMYPGLPGEHDPQDLLNLKVNEQGWILSPIEVRKIIRKLENDI